MHESFSSACLFDMGEGIREKRGRRAVSPSGFWGTIGLSTWIMDSDNLWDRQAFLLQSFISQTHLLKIILFMETCKRKTIDFRSRLSNLISLFSIWEKKLRESPWLKSSLIGQEFRLLTSLLSSLESQDSITLQLGLSLANLQTTHLSGQGWIYTDPIFWANVTQQMCESDLYATQI